MQRLFTLLTIALLVSFQQATAQSVESFDYAAGATIEGLDGGTNWDGNWTTLKGDGQSATADGNITVGALGASSGTNHLAIIHSGSGGIRAFRKLAAPITDDGNTYYMSWFQDADYDNPAMNGAVAQAIITRSAAFGAGGPEGQLVRMGKIFGSEEFGVDGANGLGAQRISGSDTRDAYFVIAKITMSGDAERDTVRIYLNPSLDATELDNAAADMTRTPNLNDGFDAFGFKVEGGAAVNAAFDEFRFGASVSEVIGDNVMEVAGANVDQFNEYDSGSGLDGQNGGLGWGGPWVTRSGDDPVITDDGLKNFTILRETSGKRVAAQFSGTMGDSRYFRPLNTRFADDGSTYYFSYSQVSTYQNRGASANFFMLLDSMAYQSGGPGGQLVQIGKPLNRPFIGVGVGATNNFEMTDALAEEVHFVVVKVSTSGNADPDTVRIFLDPMPGDGEPVDADATKLIGTNLNNGFDAVGFKITGTQPGATMDWDDVTVGLDFNAVLPADRLELEPLSSAFVVETFNTYGSGDDLAGADGGQGWAGPWQALGALDSTSVRGQGLLNNDLLAATSGNSSRTISTGVTEQAIRYLESPLDTSDNASFWFSTHLGVSGNVAGSVGNFILIDSTFGDNQNRVIIGKQFGNRNLFVTGVGAGNTQTGEQFGNGAAFVVGHMTRENGQWLLDVFVNPDPAAGEPAEADANVMNKVYNAGNFDAISVRTAGGGVGLQWDVDDIYLGAEWGDVLPPDLTAIPAAPLGATEKFDYAAGTSLVGADGGTGWTGPWRAVTESPDAGVVAEGITSFPLLKATSGSSANLPSYQRIVRPLAGAYGDNGRDFWIGWWMDVDNVGNNVVQFVMADTAAYMATGAGGQLVQIGNKFSGGTIGAVPGGNAAGITAEDGHFFVAHVITNGSAANDQVIVWVDPALDAIPSADTASFVSNADLTNWNGIGFKFDGDAGLTTQAFFDDILIGFSFNEVVPGDLMDVQPPSLPVAAVETFDYDAGQELNGADGGAGWAGPWLSVSGSVMIADGNLESDRTCPDGNQASLDQSGAATPAQIVREFFNPFGTDGVNSTFYASFSLNIDSKDIGNAGGFGLIDSNDENILSIGGIPGISSLGYVVGEGVPQTVTGITAEGTKWFVVRMDIDGTAGTASVKVFVDPAADAIPADESAAISIDGVDVSNGISGVTLFGQGAQSVSLLADDIRAGFSYRDISCQFGSDDPNLLVYEPFNYDVGTDLDGAGGVNAFWDGPWKLDDVRENSSATMFDGSIDYPDYIPAGNRARFNLAADGEGLDIQRPLAFPVESDGSTYWFTFLMNTVVPDAPNNIGNVMFINTGIGDRGGRRFAIGRNFGTQRLGSIVVPNNNVRTTDVDDDGLHWLVARIQTTGDANIPDTFSLWIDPALDVEPDTADASHYQYFETNIFKEGFDALRIRVLGVNGNEAPYVTEFDEIRLADTWQSARVTTNTIEPEVNDPFQLTAFPNPTQSEITISYELERTGKVNVELFNMNGQRVSQLYSGDRPAGLQRTTLNINGDQSLRNGFYLLRVTQNGQSTTRKLILYR